MGVQASDQFLRVMLNPFVVGRDGSFFNPSMAEAGSDQRSFRPQSTAGERRFAVWGAVYGEAANSSGEGRVVGSARRTGSDGHVAVGADFTVMPGVIAGFAVSGGQGNSKLGNGLGTSRADIYQVGLYGLGRFGALSVGVSGSYGSLQTKTSRAIPALGFSGVSADYRAESWSGRIETAYTLVRLNGFGVAPIAAVQAQSVRSPRFVERNGGAANLVAHGTTNTTMRTELGMKFDYVATFANAPVNFYISAAWAHYAISDAKFSANLSGLAGSGFTVEGARPSRDAAVIAIGADMQIGSNVHLGGRFDTELAPSHRSFSGSIKLRAAF
jgi:outer membrane autotransporter protein